MKWFKRRWTDEDREAWNFLLLAVTTVGGVEFGFALLLSYLTVWPLDTVVPSMLGVNVGLCYVSALVDKVLHRRRVRERIEQDALILKAQALVDGQRQEEG